MIFREKFTGQEYCEEAAHAAYGWEQHNGETRLDYREWLERWFEVVKEDSNLVDTPKNDG